jgi:uncharacterized protein YjiS (DUF1127 family)
MALSLPGERSLAAGSHVHPVRALFAFVARTRTNRARRAAFKSMLELDAATLKDLGITRGDIVDALNPANGRTAAMVLNAARARNARA